MKGEGVIRFERRMKVLLGLQTCVMGAVLVRRRNGLARESTPGLNLLSLLLWLEKEFTFITRLLMG